jgi:hypothetical protein
MRVMQRLVFQLNRGKWDEVPDLLSRINAMESSYGMLPGRRYIGLAEREG